LDQPRRDAEWTGHRLDIDRLRGGDKQEATAHSGQSRDQDPVHARHSFRHGVSTGATVDTIRPPPKLVSRARFTWLRSATQPRRKTRRWFTQGPSRPVAATGSRSPSGGYRGT